MLTDRILAAIKSRRERKESRGSSGNRRAEIQHRYLREILEAQGVTSVKRGPVTVSMKPRSPEMSARLDTLWGAYRTALESQRAYADHLEQQLRGYSRELMRVEAQQPQGWGALRAVAAGNDPVTWVQDGIPHILRPERAREILRELERPQLDPVQLGVTSVNKNMES